MNDSNIVPAPSHAGEHVGGQATPGPWSTHRTASTINVYSPAARRTVARMAITPLSVYVAEGLANARMIAAAPCLLEALKELRTVGNDMKARLAARQKADAAIAKATEGRT